MQLSFSTNAFVKHSVFEAVERIASVGYKGVELLADVPHLYADSVTEADLERLKALLDRTGLHVANINANTAVGYYGTTFWEPLFEPSLAHPDSDLRRWRIDYSKKCVDIAASLGAPTVSITSGRPVSGMLPTKSMTLLHGSLQELLEYAAERSVRIGIEYEPGLLVERYEELAALIEAMDSPHLGANLDLGHSHVLGEDPEIAIGGLGSRIFHVHIEDIKGTKHYHLIPGTGDMDFPKLLATLTRHGYEGFVTVELYTYPDRPEQAATEALNFMRSIFV
ncbi:MAG: sugar phosphate isomerase/epimerase family protein [Thermodesulfobacteriota bacterium]